MDFTKINCISQACKGKNSLMRGGGSSGGRVTYASLKCEECGFTMIVMPTSDKYEYTFSAVTPEERENNRIKNEISKAKIELAERILQFKGADFGLEDILKLT